MSSGIYVKNLNKGCGLNDRFIKRVTAEILKRLKRAREQDLEIIFLDDLNIKALNKKYLKKDRPTDVISFQLGRVASIFISSDTARRNSKIFNTKFENELTLCLIHGILHLYDYDDALKKDRIRMSEKQEKILNSICVPLDLSKVLMPR